jgi:dihydrofolate reductase
MVTMIAAAAENNALGKDNKLLWHLPDDFKRFKSITTGHHIIMGRKTFESFPKPLPNRTHIIITRQKNYIAEGCITTDSLENALAIVPGNQDCFIIGGGQIYKQGIAVADAIDLTRVHTNIDADTFFPEINSKDWELTDSEFHPADEKHAYSFTFETYHRRGLHQGQAI